MYWTLHYKINGKDFNQFARQIKTPHVMFLSHDKRNLMDFCHFVNIWDLLALCYLGGANKQGTQLKGKPIYCLF